MSSRLARSACLALLLAAPLQARAPRSGAPGPGAPGPAGMDPARAAQAGAADESALVPQGFAIPETRGARERLDGARHHLAAGRLRQGIEELQALLELHEGDVLGAERPELEGRPSLLAVHRGAAVRARELLLALPPEGRALYRERYESAAATALARALAARDRAALCEIARRWPLCVAAARAWLAEGDLEHEAAQPRAALHAWRAALELALALDAAPGERPSELAEPARWSALAARALPTGRAAAEAAARRGAAFAADPSAERLVAAARAERQRGELRLAGSGEGLGPPPARGADAWPSPVRIPMHDLANAGCLFPVRSGDAVLVSNSMRLIAADAYTGERLWDSGEVPGWEALDLRRREEFFEGVDTTQALIAPAAGGRIAVAALQIPITHVEPDSFQRIPITKILPDRRLFAFDLETGAPLWNHLPPPGWDGESGDFVARMRVAGPPVIAGSRLLAPMVRMQGRIDYHLACFDLASGVLLWSTDLISGQRETNMFGRALQEFSAPPPRVEGERVLALTQLGAIAALDLYTGEILWETLYDQIPLPKGRQYDPTLRKPTWRNAAPVVADGLLIATPSDGDDLVALDLESGAVAWSLSRERLRAMVRRDARLDLLLGADDTTVYLSGDRIAALEAPAGLRRQPPAAARWVFEDDALDGLGRFRPVLARDHVVVPSSSARIEIDRLHGKRTLTAAWPSGPSSQAAGGNLLVDDGALYKVSTRDLSGFLEWDALLARARRAVADHPDDPRAALVLAERLAGHGVALWRSEGKSDEARRVLSEARELLERFAPPGSERAASVARELFGVLRTEARVRADLADGAGALRTLERARELAPTPEALRDVLVEELALLGARPLPGEHERRSELLAALEDEAGELPLACEARPADLALDGSEPLATLTPRSEELVAGDAPRLTLPVSLWVHLERAHLAAEAGDVAGELAELGLLLRRWSDVSLGDHELGELATRRVAWLARSAPAAALTDFEAEARQRLERALAEDDRAGLASVARGWPHTRAAREANDALLGRAQGELDLGAVAGIVRSELGAGFAYERAGERELALLLRLARAAERAGNEAFAHGLVRRLGAAQPQAPSPLAEDHGAALGELAAALPAPAPSADAPRAGRFGLTLATSAGFGGEHEVLGRLDLAQGADSARGEVLLVARTGDGRSTGELLALAEDGGQTPLWTFSELDAPRLWSGRVAIAAERVLVATPSRVIALDARDGTPAWSFSEQAAQPQGVQVADGVALVVLERPGRQRELVALDARAGAPLWRVDAGDEGRYPHPLVGSGRVAFLPQSPHRQLAVHDLYTGRLAFELQLPDAPSETGALLRECAWIEGDLLVLPSFQQRDVQRDDALAIDLANGRVAWRLSIRARDGQPRTLDAIVQHAERSFLLVHAVPSAANPLPTGELRELVVRDGTLSAPLFGLTLGPDDVLAGVGGVGAGARTARVRVRLPTPDVFVRSPARGGRATLLRRIHLGQGERWAYVLPVAPKDFSSARSPLPALSEDTVAFAYSSFRERRRGLTPLDEVTVLELLDAQTGLRRDGRVLPAEMGNQESLELVPFGASLLVRGQHTMEVLR